VVVRLFHPREDRWEEHFRVAAESGTIEGLTPIGRATVMRLGMNSAPRSRPGSSGCASAFFPNQTRPNNGVQPTAYRCDVKVVRQEWSYDRGDPVRLSSSASCVSGNGGVCSTL
jgi:hypothetical protein